MQKRSHGTQNNSETSDSALLFETHNLLVRCLVPPGQLLEVNVFVEGGEAAMRRVQTFVNSTSSAGGRPIGSRAMPQIGQLSGPSVTISGCIGQVNCVPAGAFAAASRCAPDR